MTFIFYPLSGEVSNDVHVLSPLNLIEKFLNCEHNNISLFGNIYNLYIENKGFLELNYSTNGPSSSSRL